MQQIQTKVKMQVKSVTRVLVLGCLLSTPVQAITGNPGTIYLNDGSYNNILVAVDQAVEFHENVLPNLKEYFQLASDVLHEATKAVSARRFGEVTFLFPRTWPVLQQCQSSSTENQIAANFIVEKDTNLWRSNPHTLRMDSQCGSPGKSTYLPRSFVIDQVEAKKYGDNIGKTLIHEWGHLRYGLFDELDEVMDPTTCQLFENGVMQPIKCSTSVTGDLYKSADGKTCSFQAHLQQPSNVKASLMYLPYLDTVSTFCNKTGDGITHNSEVQNPQNNRCNGKSAWEVMMQHQDFSTHKVSAPQTSSVHFRCVQESDAERMVLVMDVSGSMQEEHRIDRMEQDVNVFLKNLPCRDTSIGMVEFSSDMNETLIIHPLAKLNEGENVANLKMAIPVKTKDKTCIGCGILRAIQLVEDSNIVVNGTVLAVFTDGQENMEPSIQQVENDVISRGIVVYSIMLMSQARDHPLIQLSTKTGGKSCTYSDSQHTTYYDCLSAILHHRSPLTAPNQIMSEIISLNPRSNYTGYTVIDAELTEHVDFVFSWSSEYLGGCEDTLISITSPDNVLINKHSGDVYEYKYNLRTVSIDASGYMSGRWKIVMLNTDYHVMCVVRVMVGATQLIDDCSTARTAGHTQVQPPVLIFPTIDSQKVVLDKEKDPIDNAIKLYTEVRKGQNAIIDADVEAYIENENGDHWTVHLYDNGTGADAVANDGVYSRYFTGYNKDGTYTATFNVIGSNKTKVLLESDNLRHFAAPLMPEYRESNSGTKYESIDPFRRTKVAGFFEVVNFIQAENETETVQAWFPPPQIVDLNVLHVEPGTGIITLQWTAVGNTLDNGTAASYEIRMYTSADYLRNNFNNSHLIQMTDVITGNINQAKHVGQKELFVINTKSITFEKNRLYYIAVKTVNSYNKKSPISNVAMFQYVEVTTSTQYKSTVLSTTSTSTIIVTTKSASTETFINNGAVNNGQDSNNTTPLPVKEKDKPFPAWIYYVIAGLGGCLLLTILLLCMVCCRRSSKKGAAEKTEETPQTFIGPEGMTTASPVEVFVDVEGGVGGGSDQEPDLIKEIHDKEIHDKEMLDKDIDRLKHSPYEKQGPHGTWPAANKYNARRKKDKKKSSSNIFRSIGRSHFITGIRKKLGSGKSDERLDREWSSKPGGSNVPLQDQPYSNPLFGQGVMVPEIHIENSIIIQKSRPPSPIQDSALNF